MINKILNSSNEQAKLIGYSLIVMAVIAGFSLGYAFPFFMDESKRVFIAEIVLQEKLLYILMLIGVLLVIALDFLVSILLYLFFKQDNKRIALVSFFLRIAYSFIFLMGSCFLIINVGESENIAIINNLNLFKKTWNIGLIIFGVHIYLLGLLMKFHKTIPKTLYYTTVFAGISYFIVHLLKVSMNKNQELINLLEIILMLPMALGELGLAFWLLIKFKNDNKE